MIRTLEELINTLGDKLKPAICHKYGLIGYKHLEKNKDIAKELGVNVSTVGSHLKVSLRRLKHISRAKFFCLMPDNLLEDVFGSTDAEEIFYNINIITPALSDFKKEVRDMYKSYISSSEKYIDKVDGNYSKFCEILSGSEFYSFLTAVDRLSDKIGSQAKNMHDSIEIINRYMMQHRSNPDIEIRNCLNELNEKMLRLEDILLRFDKSWINAYADKIVCKNSI